MRGQYRPEYPQTALDIFGTYARMCNDGQIEFDDNEEKLEFFELLVSNHKNFYPSDKLFEKGELKIAIGTNEFEEWLPRLEELVNSTSLIYYLLADKIIAKEIIYSKKI